MVDRHSHPTRVAIVGAGNVGATFAYTLLLSGLAAEIVILDTNRDKAEGEVMDLNHAVPLNRPTHIWAGEYADCSGSTVTVITAGVGQQPGESRLDVLRRNTDDFRQIIPQVVEHNPDGILLIATNLVDLLTYIAWKLSGLPAPRVIGSGTILDTARFRYLLSKHLGVDPRSIHAFIIGEHGDSEVPVWSLANIAGMRLPVYCEAHNLTHDQGAMDDIFLQTRDAAHQIINRKGATYYAIASGLVRIVEAILRDQRTVLSVSSLIEDYYGIHDISFNLPTVVDRGGVEQVLKLDLNPEEIKLLGQSAQVLKATLDQLDLEET